MGVVVSVALQVDWDKIKKFRHSCDDDFDPEIHDVRHVLMHVGELMVDADCASLILPGVGGDTLNINVAIDLPILMEQLPSAIRALRSTVVRELEITFYEQQPPLALVFRKNGDKISTWYEYIFDRSEATAGATDLKRADVLGMLTEILSEFVGVARLLCPEMVENCSAFDEWFEEAGVDLKTD
jgi:hypothetical protein